MRTRREQSARRNTATKVSNHGTCCPARAAGSQSQSHLPTTPGPACHGRAPRDRAPLPGRQWMPRFRAPLARAHCGQPLLPPRSASARRTRRLALRDFDPPRRRIFPKGKFKQRARACTLSVPGCTPAPCYTPSVAQAQLVAQLAPLLHNRGMSETAERHSTRAHLMMTASELRASRNGAASRPICRHGLRRSGA
jgi:hypothetical protein